MNGYSPETHTTSPQKATQHATRHHETPHYALPITRRPLNANTTRTTSLTNRTPLSTLINNHLTRLRHELQRRRPPTKTTHHLSTNDSHRLHTLRTTPGVTAPMRSCNVIASIRRTTTRHWNQLVALTAQRVTLRDIPIDRQSANPARLIALTHIPQDRVPAT